MPDIQSTVESFMLKANQPPEITAKFRGTDQEHLYMDLVTEEFLELNGAFSAKDIVETADAIADLVWVLMGLASTLGIPFDPVWEEVKRSNESKVTDGKLLKNVKTGKVMKPDTYSAPDLEAILDES
tara:strand:- start:4196 stop:4576 length:381 start_codon:yes stop_codon:yes gene_type:complete